jgi:hypothetical protein
VYEVRLLRRRNRLCAKFGFAHLQKSSPSLADRPAHARGVARANEFIVALALIQPALLV